MMKKKWSIAHLRNKVVWPAFSRYIRMKYADWRGDAECVTCGKVQGWKQMQAGHFIPGRKNAFLFDERGVHPQCYLCNGPLKGNPRKYQAFMLQKYGQKVIDELDALSNTTKQFTYDELIDLKNLYEDKIKALQ